jgi:hypothetical protein
LTDTEQGRRTLGLDATSRQDKLVALISAAITERNMWRRHHTDDCYEELQNFEIFCSTISKTTISEIEKQKLMNQLEREWYRIVRDPADSRNGMMPLPDFLGFSASRWCSAYVVSRLKEIQLIHRKEISQDYKNYLLQLTTSSSRREVYDAHQWHSQLHFIQFLLNQGAKSDHAIKVFLGLKGWSYFTGVYVAEPISNIIQEALGVITRRTTSGVKCGLLHSTDVASDLCRTIRLAIQSGDSCERQVTVPIFFTDDKVRFPNCLAICRPNLSENSCIVLVTNIVFHAQLLLDVLAIRHRGIEQSPEFIDLDATVTEEFIRNRQISATAKLALYTHRSSPSAGNYKGVQVTPTSVDPDGLRLKIRQMLQSESDHTKFERFREEMFGMVYEAASNNVRYRYKIQFDEALRGRRSDSWPSPEGYSQIWPPPMFVENDRLQYAAT